MITETILSIIGGDREHPDAYQVHTRGDRITVLTVAALCVIALVYALASWGIGLAEWLIEVL